jgi:hypothetical protein
MAADGGIGLRFPNPRQRAATRTCAGGRFSPARRSRLLLSRAPGAGHGVYFGADLCYISRAMSHEPAQTKDWTHLFAHYRGQWVALADDEVTVVAAGASAKDALAASAAKGSPEPLLYRVPDSLDAFVG